MTRVLVALLLMCLATPGAAQERRDVAGRFDYWVLALSWSPTFCSDPQNADRAQCAGETRHGFIVHGLWPQYQRGWPQRCATSEPGDTPWALRRSMLDLMPSPGLVEHQWDEHGVCAGLSQKDYFDRVRRMRQSIGIPKRYLTPERAFTATGFEIEAEFARSNPGLTGSMMAVQCTKGVLREVRICLTREGRLRECGADVKDRCGSRPVLVPPVR